MYIERYMSHSLNIMWEFYLSECDTSGPLGSITSRGFEFLWQVDGCGGKSIGGVKDGGRDEASGPSNVIFKATVWDGGCAMGQNGIDERWDDTHGRS